MDCFHETVSLLRSERNGFAKAWAVLLSSQLSCWLIGKASDCYVPAGSRKSCYCCQKKEVPSVRSKDVFSESMFILFPALSHFLFQPLAPSDCCPSSSSSSITTSTWWCLPFTHLQISSSSSSSERFITFNYLNFIPDLYLAYLIWASAGLLVTLNTQRLIDLRQRGAARCPSDA